MKIDELKFAKGGFVKGPILPYFSPCSETIIPPQEYDELKLNKLIDFSEIPSKIKKRRFQ